MRMLKAPSITVTVFGQSFRYSKYAIWLSDTRTAFYQVVGRDFQQHVIEVFHWLAAAGLPNLSHQARYFKFEVVDIRFLFNVFEDEK